MRKLLVVAALAALAVALAVAFSIAAPRTISCAPGPLGDPVVCRDTVTAAMERGLAPFHPLVLGALVEPGETAGTTENGHRATVSFDLLGVPGPTTVRLFYDIGGHWGGVPSRGATELATWALAAAAITVGVVAAVFALIARIRRKRVRLRSRTAE